MCFHRAQHLKDFIKYGCDTAELEIELFKEGGNVVIHRKISSTKSDWKINGKTCKQEDVIATVAKLNIQVRFQFLGTTTIDFIRMSLWRLGLFQVYLRIKFRVLAFHLQVDNLCQFLPQDRVADFAKMTPQELLVGTEQAVGSATLIKNHEKLKDFQKTSDELISRIKSVESRLDQTVQLNEHLEAELSTFREYQKVHTAFLVNISELIPTAQQKRYFTPHP